MQLYVHAPLNLPIFNKIKPIKSIERYCKEFEDSEIDTGEGRHTINVKENALIILYVYFN